jgi:hypothetical protein
VVKGWNVKLQPSFEAGGEGRDSRRVLLYISYYDIIIFGIGGKRVRW